MYNARIFSAPSLSEVIQFLMLHRLSGTLTIRSASSPRLEEVRITVEYGRPAHIYWGMYYEEAHQSFLRQLNAWGEIHFTFLQTVAPLLQLPAPQPIRQAQLPPQQPSLRPPIAPEVVPLPTANAKGYPFEKLPRYDRTIFLLINGRRSIADLTQLTRRSLEEVYVSLHRLKDQRLIVLQP